MRVWHFLFLVMLSAILLTVSREPTGRVAIVVFFTGLGEFILGLTAIMFLFRTIAALGYSRSVLAWTEAFVTTIVVVVIASVTMNALLWCGVSLMQRVVPP